MAVGCLVGVCGLGFCLDRKEKRDEVAAWSLVTIFSRDMVPMG